MSADVEYRRQVLELLNQLHQLSIQLLEMTGARTVDEVEEMVDSWRLQP